MPFGIDIKARVVRLPQRSRADFLAALAACDLALDTFGFSGGNTSLDALSVGLPVVTLPGQFMRGRQTLAMLHMFPATVQTELIAANETDFVLRAGRLLRDGNTRNALRQVIQANAHRLFDRPEPVAALRAWLLQTIPAIAQQL